MGKLSINLPDDQEARLRQYADEHDQPVSQVVSQALEDFLAGPGPPPPPPPPPPPANDIRQLQGYVSQLATHLEGVKALLHSYGMVGAPWAGSPCLPPPLPPPPWQTQQRNAPL